MDNSQSKVRLHAKIIGRVQGVSYRYYTQLKALEIGLSGWVRNLPDGSVELMVEGSSADVKTLIDWCQIDPSMADVVDIQLDSYPATGEYKGFEIRFLGRGWLVTH